MLVVVAGFHRSGTSLAARSLAEAGLHLGDQLLGPAESNRHGHYEDREVLDIHNRLLADNCRSWRVIEEFIPVVADDIWDQMKSLIDRRTAAHETWGFKDPRVCLFLPLWRHLVPDLKVVAPVRYPTACIDSLERRAAVELFEGRGPSDERLEFWQEDDLALRMWITYNRTLLRSMASSADNALAVRFSSLQDGFDLPAAVAQKWGLDLEEAIPDELLDITDVHFHRDDSHATTTSQWWPEALSIWQKLTEFGDPEQQLSGAGREPQLRSESKP